MTSPELSPAATGPVAPGAAPSALRKPYVNYVLGVLTLVYVFNFIDRQILSILMQPIKEEMQLSDTALGFLSGISFALFYATLGIPIARLADRKSRVTIISISLGLWSFMTALCGLAQNFWQLLGARILVGVGEAGSGPSSHSLIADYVPLEARSSALAIYSTGIPIGLLIGFLAGGYLEEIYGWRAAFMVLGLPGLALALLVRLTLREPQRGLADGKPRMAGAEQASLREVAQTLWKRKSFRHISIGVGVQSIAGYGVVQWMPSFLHRSYQMTGGQIGLALAIIIGLGGALGTAAGGHIADRLARRDIRWQMWVPAMGGLMAAPFAIGVYLSHTAFATLAWFTLPVIFSSVYLGPAFAMTQALAPIRMRAMAAAVLLFAGSLIGLGIGPQFVGILSDLLYPYYGDESLRYAMLTVSMTIFWAAAHYWSASKTLIDDLALENESVALKIAMPDK
ncbi:MAG: MFS transporter [Alphaproteobacteria bacterium]|nr:MFS transporter [Alphaproteobacteria bacterium]